MTSPDSAIGTSFKHVQCRKRTMFPTNEMWQTPLPGTTPNHIYLLMLILLFMYTLYILFNLFIKSCILRLSSVLARIYLFAVWLSCHYAFLVYWQHTSALLWYEASRRHPSGSNPLYRITGSRGSLANATKISLDTSANYKQPGCINSLKYTFCMRLISN